MGYTIWPDGPTGDVLQDINKERYRQEELKAAGRFPHTCADKALSPAEKLAVLAEEFGEVARCVLEVAKLANDTQKKDPRAALRKELIQVAAVCTAWCEALDR